MSEAISGCSLSVAHPACRFAHAGYALIVIAGLDPAIHADCPHRKSGRLIRRFARRNGENAAWTAESSPAVTRGLVRVLATDYLTLVTKSDTKIYGAYIPVDALLKLCY
jgi:hypothetical protein